MAKEVNAVQEPRGWIGQVVLSRDPLGSKEPTAVRALQGFYPTKEGAIAAAVASLNPVIPQVTPAKADLTEKKKGGK